MRTFTDRTLCRRAFAACLATVAVFASTSLASSEAHAEPIRSPGRFGLGLGSGTLMNGLSAKYFLNKGSALQFGLGSYGGHGFKHRWDRFDAGLGLGVDYLFEMPTIVRAGQAFDLAWNFGAGVGLGLDGRDNHDAFALAGAFVLGLEFDFIPAPFDIVLEWRPSVLLVPDVGFDAVDFTAHIRFYF